MFTSGPSTPVSRRQKALVACGLAALAGTAVLGPGLSSPASAAPSLAGARAQAAAVASRVATLDAQMARQDEALDQAQNRLSMLDTQLSASRRQLAATQATLAAKRTVLKQAAVAAYIQGGETGNIVQLMQGNQAQAGLRQSYLSSVADAQQGAIDSYHAALLAYQQQQARLAQQESAAQAQVSRARAAREASTAAATAEHAELSAVNGQVAGLVAQIQQQQAQATAARLQSSLSSRLGGRASRGGSVGPGLPPPTGAGASLAVEWAQREIGKPYVYGASGPNSFDCSGLTMYVWEQAGVSLPHSAAGQWDDTTRIPVSALEPGDLVFYYSPVDHVGIYVGGGKMIIADHTGTDVRYASIYRDGLDGGGRVG
jgi:peptidoglycan DL-endopeptidase CwlO